MTISYADDGFIHGHAAGTALLIDARGPGVPAVVHWGGDLGGNIDADAIVSAGLPPRARGALAVHTPVSLLPERARGYRGRPGLTGHRDGADWSASFRLDRVAATGPDSVEIAAEDPGAGLQLRCELRFEASGVLTLRHVLRNAGTASYTLMELSCVLPVPRQAVELLDFTGRWSRERHPQRSAFDFGSRVRENRRGRTGHDAAFVLAAGTTGFGFRSGEVWAAHLGWSGDSTMFAERAPDGRAVVGGAELLGPGEVVLGPGEEYTTPWLYAAHSRRGLDGISSAFHSWLRARPQHPSRPRPVTLNTWEAVYFDHDLERLTRLADTAAQIGVERFVLDDGWFRHRRDDTAGLGDWYVDEGVWPKGLHPLIDHVVARGMEFGLWFEPEMINPDSDLYRAHPDWLLQTGGRMPPAWRNQQVLDLANPDAYAYLLERIDALLSEYDIAYIKWDHNRDLMEAGHEGQPAVHRQTLAVYRLLDELRSRHPRVEIESCSSGGARVDLGILQRTDRVWASDTNDALERQSIQRWTGLLLPPELIGAHIGPPTSHTTGRTHTLSFRAATALFCHFGMEWDIASAAQEDLDGLQSIIGFYKQLRGLLHHGEVVRGDHPDPAAWVHGVVAADRSQALFAYVQLATSVTEVPGPAALPGLDDDRRYRVQAVHPAGEPSGHSMAPPWMADGGIVLTGRELEAVGLQMPVLDPENVLLLLVTPIGK
ncbi:MAG TPA: alpha-galactosidase [Egibacteraceae bacterium]|nr:alpha-galactosidase [Egibacteraceae bacterium]